MPQPTGTVLISLPPALSPRPLQPQAVKAKTATPPATTATPPQAVVVVGPTGVKSESRAVRQNSAPLSQLWQTKSCSIRTSGVKPGGSVNIRPTTPPQPPKVATSAVVSARLSTGNHSPRCNSELQSTARGAGKKAPVPVPVSPQISEQRVPCAQSVGTSRKALAKNASRSVKDTSSCSPPPCEKGMEQQSVTNQANMSGCGSAAQQKISPPRGSEKVPQPVCELSLDELKPLSMLESFVREEVRTCREEMRECREAIAKDADWHNQMDSRVEDWRTRLGLAVEDGSSLQDVIQMQVRQELEPLRADLCHAFRDLRKALDLNGDGQGAAPRSREDGSCTPPSIASCSTNGRTLLLNGAASCTPPSTAKQTPRQPSRQVPQQSSPRARRQSLMDWAATVDFETSVKAETAERQELERRLQAQLDALHEKLAPSCNQAVQAATVVGTPTSAFLGHELQLQQHQQQQQQQHQQQQLQRELAELRSDVQKWSEAQAASAAQLRTFMMRFCLDPNEEQAKMAAESFIGSTLATSAISNGGSMAGSPNSSKWPGSPQTEEFAPRASRTGSGCCSSGSSRRPSSPKTEELGPRISRTGLNSPKGAFSREMPSLDDDLDLTQKLDHDQNDSRFREIHKRDPGSWPFANTTGSCSSVAGLSSVSDQAASPDRPPPSPLPPRRASPPSSGLGPEGLWASAPSSSWQGT